MMIPNLGFVKKVKFEAKSLSHLSKNKKNHTVMEDFKKVEDSP